MSEFKKIGLVGRTAHKGVEESLQRLCSFLQEQQVAVRLDEKTATMMPDHGLEVMPRARLCAENDLVVVVGGDGSMLNVAHDLASHRVPVIGVNRGRLGFLTDILPEEIEQRMGEVLRGEYSEESRFLIEFEVRRGDRIITGGCALNDIVLHPGTAAQMIEFELFIADQFVNSQESDGLIVATPTGSTAYALSAGGPIMHPSLNALVLVPMYPHSLSSRPLVVDAENTIRVNVVKQRSLMPQISCDGVVMFTTEPADQIIIKRKQGELRLIHPLDQNYFQTCRSKLGWGNRLVKADD
ncbi:MAG: NAD(+) kinase [Pseudomonadales bacterium]|nr:NAD(+) kinase [Pseudomonadales bacterium]